MHRESFRNICRFSDSLLIIGGDVWGRMSLAGEVCGGFADRLPEMVDRLLTAGALDCGCPGSVRTAWVAPMTMRYRYHCVWERMGVPRLLRLESLFVYLLYLKVRNLGCICSGRKLFRVVLWGECRRL